jgi:hypothetical protein
MKEPFWSLSSVLGVLAIASALALTTWLFLYA